MSVDQESLPRCEKLDGSTLRIVPAYTEAGRFCEANCVTITDGERTAVYVPVGSGASYVKLTPEEAEAHQRAAKAMRDDWFRRSPAPLHENPVVAHMMAAVQDPPPHMCATTPQPLPEHLIPWAKMSREQLQKWAGRDGAKWSRAAWFRQELMRLGHPAFPSRPCAQ